MTHHWIPGLLLSLLLLTTFIPPACGAEEPDVESVVALLELVIDADEATARKCLGVLTTQIQNGALDSARITALRQQLGEQINTIVLDPEHPLRPDATTLAALWGDAAAQSQVKTVFYDEQRGIPDRIDALKTLIAAGATSEVLHGIRDVINSPAGPTFRIGVIDSLSGVKDEVSGPLIAALLVDNLPKWEPEVRPKAIEVLTQRPSWSTPLLAAIQQKVIDKEALNLNQLRRVAAFKDDAIQSQFKEIYGTLREGRNPNREQVFYQMRDFLNGTPGDPLQGQAVFKKLCAQCHKIYGEGPDVGPDITRSGRNNWDQLLMNVFDPSAVIGPGYQARLLATTDGRVLTGLPVEESDLRVILKIQGGKLETIPRDQIEEYKVSELSLMPDELEKQLTPQQLADLFAFLALDRPPGDLDAKLLNGAPEPLRSPNR